MNASYLLCQATNGKPPSGPNRCCYCGNPCHGLNATKDYLKTSFTDFDSLVCPQSTFVCDGCVLAMREKVDMPGKDKPQKTRNYSWLITPDAAIPYSKADIAKMRSICLAPPEPPFAMVIAVSGQKQLIFKTPASLDPQRPVVTLEGEVIQYLPAHLAERMRLVVAVVEACGKPSLAAAPDISMAMRLSDVHGDRGIELFEAWQAVWTQPLSRLASFLAPSQKELKS